MSTRPPTSGHVVEDEATVRSRNWPPATLTLPGALQLLLATPHVWLFSELKSSRQAVLICVAADDGTAAVTSRHKAAEATARTWRMDITGSSYPGCGGSGMPRTGTAETGAHQRGPGQRTDQ